MNPLKLRLPSTGILAAFMLLTAPIGSAADTQWISFVSERTFDITVQFSPRRAAGEEEIHGLVKVRAESKTSVQVPRKIVDDGVILYRWKKEGDGIGWSSWIARKLDEVDGAWVLDDL